MDWKKLAKYKNGFLAAFISWFLLTWVVGIIVNLLSLRRFYDLAILPIIISAFVFFFYKNRIDSEKNPDSQEEFDSTCQKQDKSCGTIQVPLDDIPISRQIDRTITGNKSVLEFKPIPVDVPNMFTEKEYAVNLIDSAKEYAAKINNSTTVMDFVVAYKMIKQTLEKLAWFNEERKIFMYPTPRSDFQKMYDNMENTINDFIFRSMGRIKKAGGEWSEELKKLFDEMEKDSCFSNLMTGSNRVQIQEIRENLTKGISDILPLPARKSQSSVSKPKALKKVSPSPAPVSIDYTQILRDEAAWRKEQARQPIINQDVGDLFIAAMSIVIETEEASVPVLQQRLNVSQSRAEQLIDQMEKKGYISPSDCAYPRRPIISAGKWAEIVERWPENQ